MGILYMRFPVMASALVLFLAPAAFADAPSKAVSRQADALTREGTSHFRLNEFDAALKSYQEAYRLAPKPELLYDIGQCYRKLDNKQAAVDAFRSFLQESTDEGQKVDVRALVEKLETAIRDEASAANNRRPAPVPGRLRVTSQPDGAAVRFDDHQTPRQGMTPVEFSDLTAGPLRIAITKDGYQPVERMIEIVPDRDASLDVRLVPTVPVSAAPQVARANDRVARPVYKRWWFWTVIGGVALAGAGVGIGLALTSDRAAPMPSVSSGTFHF